MSFVTSRSSICPGIYSTRLCHIQVTGKWLFVLFHLHKFACHKPALGFLADTGGGATLFVTAGTATVAAAAAPVAATATFSVPRWLKSDWHSSLDVAAEVPLPTKNPCHANVMKQNFLTSVQTEHRHGFTRTGAQYPSTNPRCVYSFINGLLLVGVLN